MHIPSVTHGGPLPSTSMGFSAPSSLWQPGPSPPAGLLLSTAVAVWPSTAATSCATAVTAPMRTSAVGACERVMEWGHRGSPG